MLHQLRPQETVALGNTDAVKSAVCFEMQQRDSPIAFESVLETAQQRRELRTRVDPMERHWHFRLRRNPERLDFTERMLAKTREAERLPPAR